MADLEAAMVIPTRVMPPPDKPPYITVTPTTTTTTTSTAGGGEGAANKQEYKPQSSHGGRVCSPHIIISDLHVYSVHTCYLYNRLRYMHGPIPRIPVDSLRIGASFNCLSVEHVENKMAARRERPL